MKHGFLLILLSVLVGCRTGSRSTITDKTPPGRYELIDPKANRRLTVLEIPPGQQLGMEYENRTPTAALVLSQKSDGSLSTVWRQGLPKGSHYQWRAVAAAAGTTTQP